MAKHTFRYPDNVTPNRVTLKERADGRVDVYHNNNGDGKVHGHSAQEGGKIVYSRTRGGNVVADEPRGNVCPGCGKVHG